MEVYILDNKNLNILSVCRPCNYNLNLDEETNGKSEIVLPSLNYAKKGYYLVLNGLYKQFLFVIDDVITSKEENAVTVSLLDISNIFDRKIILRDKENMITNGIENYIATEMDRNFINSSDSILNLNYVDVYVHSTTEANVTINDEDNLYNFHTYLINCRQYKNIYTEFKFEGIINRRLKIDIENKSESTMLIDTTLAEVTGYNKVYEVDPVTKVEAYVREDGSVYNLYLRTDRTTTTNKNDANRLEGRIETISCDTLENAQEEALNVIRANTYKHLVEFNIAKSSKLIDIKELNIGRPIKIKTQDSIYDSYISAIILSDENFVQYKTGNLRIDFTDKQRLQQRSGIAGTKLDVSGGNVTGQLKVQGKEVATQEYADLKVSKNGDTMTGDLTVNAKIKIKNGNGYGIFNSSDYPIVDDYNNKNVTVNATGDTLFLGYKNTNGINILNSKASINSSGEITSPNFKGNWNGLIDAHGTNNTNDTWVPVFNGNKVEHRVIDKNMNNLHKTYITTGSEVATNEYVDGKQVYVKRINCGNLPNTTTKTIATGLTMTSITVIKIIGACKTSAGITFPLPFLGIADNKSGDIPVYIAADGNLTIKAYTNRSELAGYVNIYYTKN